MTTVRSVLETGAFSVEDAERLVKDFVLAAVWPGRRLASLRIERLRFTPDKECTAFCSLSLAGDEGNSRHAITIGFLPEADLAEEIERQASSGPRQEGAILFPPDGGCLVEVFPADRRMVDLPNALSPQTMAPLLGSSLLPEGADRSDFDLETRLLRYRPHSRCLIAYQFSRKDGGAAYEAIGKMYGSRSKARRAARLMAALFEQAEPLPVTPRPIEFLDKWRLLVMERVAGHAMFPILLRGSADEAGRAIRLAARALASLHSLSPNYVELDGRSYEDELAELRDQGDHFRNLAPSVVEESERLIERLDALAPAVPLRAGLLHGAFKPSQVIVGDEGATIVDLDGAALGDPALDAGNFVAKLFKDSQAEGRAQLAELGASFLDDYVALSNDPGIRPRARVYEAIALGRLAFRELHTARRTLAEPGNASLSALFLRRAQACLDKV